VPPEAKIHVLFIDPTGRARTREVAVLQAVGMDVRLVTTTAGPLGARLADVVVADLRSNAVRPGAVLRRAFEVRRPVLVITALGQVDARLTALRHGAVDHVVAPTDGRELVERVRHAAVSVAARPDPAIADLHADRTARVVRNGARTAVLTPAEMDILVTLMERAGEVVTKAELAESLASRPRPNTIEVHVSALRRKMESVGAPSIRTVHGRGYTYQGAGPGERPAVRVAT
jgi:DNA-binding response OmpR family regulator